MLAVALGGDSNKFSYTFPLLLPLSARESENVQNRCIKISKEVKSNNFCYRKVERAITLWGAQRKVQYCDSPI